MSLRNLIAAALLAAAASGQAQAPGPAFDRAPWLADYARLKVALAQGYANLEWQVSHRRFRLAGADAAIGGMLERVNSDAEATLVFARLIDAFDDPHLQLLPGPPRSAATVLPVRSQTGESASCTTSRPRPTRLLYPEAPGWKEVAKAPFPAGLVGKTGILRVPSFDEFHYAEACAAAARPGMDRRALQLATRALLDRQLGETIATLKTAGMQRLALDLTGNGGGSEWSSDMAARFFAGTLRRSEPRRAGPTCDRSALWRGEAAPCSIYSGEPSVETISDTPYWTGPLLLLVDRRSASATEEFAGWLRDNGRGRLAGERTAGAGCGYVDGGNVFVFTAARLHLIMPNCSRYTAAGLNEIEGRSPDISIEWSSLGAGTILPAIERAF